ncbi:hypothetical protein SBA5_220106 [Candidatus Sulfotelmatomonas gaucii]|uniref:Uncharacterized protein n=1 Tax=Candidatus Sulfuritelmatomonas gaucii TaxID=2043161 RepID=A0A2N9L7M4_9BACT|nr:hypothetical protein SBA5_220106 [Candidatus Sulfotelmatomonas gaucii]
MPAPRYGCECGGEESDGCYVGKLAPINQGAPEDCISNIRTLQYVLKIGSVIFGKLR